ncbi:MAG: hypothetical protein ACFFDT_03600 [Candidatus Hodarchaeota archaeon]
MEYLYPIYRSHLWIIEDMLNTGGFNEPADLARLLANQYPELYEKLLQLALAFFQQEQKNYKGKAYDPQNMTTVILSNKILIFLKMLSFLNTLNPLEQNKQNQEFEEENPKTFIELLKTQNINVIRAIGTMFSLYSHHKLQQQFIQFVIIFMEQLYKNCKDHHVFNINVDIAPIASEITTYLRTKRTSIPLTFT